MTALVARFDVSAQRGRATQRDHLQDATLITGKAASPVFQVTWSVAPENIGYFEPMFGHGVSLASVGTSRRSSGLVVATTVFIDTEV